MKKMRMLPDLNSELVVTVEVVIAMPGGIIGGIK